MYFNLQSNILPATLTTTNFLFDWNQGKLCPKNVSFNESRSSEISNEIISHIFIACNPITSNERKVQQRFNQILHSLVGKLSTSAGKRMRTSISRKTSGTIFTRIFKVPLIHYFAREFTDLKLYANLLEDLNINCKKVTSNVQKCK